MVVAPSLEHPEGFHSLLEQSWFSIELGGQFEGTISLGRQRVPMLASYP